MRSPAKRLTYEDYERIPADGDRHEIIAGEEIVTPAPEIPHQRTSRMLAGILDAWVVQHGLGEILYAPVDVVLSPEDVVQPDIVFVSTGRASIITRKNIQGAPDLVVEISSPSTAAIDRGAKGALYDRAGVAEYWIVDLTARIVEVRELGDPRRTRVIDEHRSFESALFPGLSIRVHDIF